MAYLTVLFVTYAVLHAAKCGLLSLPLDVLRVLSTFMSAREWTRGPQQTCRLLRSLQHPTKAGIFSSVLLELLPTHFTAKEWAKGPSQSCRLFNKQQLPSSLMDLRCILPLKKVLPLPTMPHHMMHTCCPVINVRTLELFCWSSFHPPCALCK